MALYVSLKVVLSPVCFLTEVASKRSNTLVKFLGKKKWLDKVELFQKRTQNLIQTNEKLSRVLFSLGTKVSKQNWGVIKKVDSWLTWTCRLSESNFEKLLPQMVPLSRTHRQVFLSLVLLPPPPMLLMSIPWGFNIPWGVLLLEPGQLSPTQQAFYNQGSLFTNLQCNKGLCCLFLSAS